MRQDVTIGARLFFIAASLERRRLGLVFITETFILFCVVRSYCSERSIHRLIAFARSAPISSRFNASRQFLR